MLASPHLGVLLLADECPHPDPALHGVSYPDGLGAVPQRLVDALGDRLVDDEPRGGAADLPVGPEAPKHAPLHRLVYIHVLEHDQRALSPEFHRARDHRSRALHAIATQVWKRLVRGHEDGNSGRESSNSEIVRAHRRAQSGGWGGGMEGGEGEFEEHRVDKGELRA